jgi:hypothetical protein
MVFIKTLTSECLMSDGLKTLEMLKRDAALCCRQPHLLFLTGQVPKDSCGDVGGAEEGASQVTSTQEAQNKVAR